MDLDFEVVELGAADHPEEGETAPDFTRPLVNDEFWEDVSLSELCAESDGPVGTPDYVTDGGRDVSPKAVTETDTIRAHVDATDYWDEEDD